MSDLPKLELYIDIRFYLHRLYDRQSDIKKYNNLEIVIYYDYKYDTKFDKQHEAALDCGCVDMNFFRTPSNVLNFEPLTTKILELVKLYGLNGAISKKDFFLESTEGRFVEDSQRISIESRIEINVFDVFVTKSQISRVRDHIQKFFEDATPKAPKKNAVFDKFFEINKEFCGFKQKGIFRKMPKYIVTITNSTYRVGG